jgi:glycosyltransferase involved in cell wall biosynthesis
MRIYAVHHISPGLTARSAMAPLAEHVGASSIYYSRIWRKIGRRSWTAGEAVRRLGVQLSGSGFTEWLPYWDEWSVMRSIAQGPAVAHFLWGEMASPLMPKRFHRRGIALVGTCHATRFRQQTDLYAYRAFHSFDRLVVVSETQKAFFLDRGYPEEQLAVIPLGIDTHYFRPRSGQCGVVEGGGGGGLKALAIGTTERDHEFLTALIKAMPPGVLNVAVATQSSEASLYHGLPGVTILPRLSDDELVQAYQQADLMLMPVRDCTASCAVLESMACGTPVMANREGGIPEYVDQGCNILIDTKSIDDWGGKLMYLHLNRDELANLRPRTRLWAETFRWEVIAEQYRLIYENALSTCGSC